MKNYHSGIPSDSCLEVRTAMATAYSVFLALCSTELDKSGDFHYEKECQAYNYWNPSTSLPIILDLDVHVHCTFH